MIQFVPQSFIHRFHLLVQNVQILESVPYSVQRQTRHAPHEGGEVAPSLYILDLHPLTRFDFTGTRSNVEG